MAVEERIASENCGCRYDIHTGYYTHYCHRHQDGAPDEDPADHPGAPGLEETCPDCRGAGVIYSPAWAEYWNRRKSGEAPLIEPQEAEELPCPACQGLGSRPNPQGEILLSFIRRHCCGRLPL
jgi:hypothetical protein